MEVIESIAVENGMAAEAATAAAVVPMEVAVSGTAEAVSSQQFFLSATRYLFRSRNSSNNNLFRSSTCCNHGISISSRSIWGSQGYGDHSSVIVALNPGMSLPV